MTKADPINTEEICPVALTVSLLSGKWKLTVLYQLLSGPKRYSELQRLLPDASDRMLTRSLQELKDDQLIKRTAFAELPVRVEYELTKDGQALVPIFDAMKDWGSKRV
ncbi:transcriptional regulator [Marinomonas sp. S3726]|uniref:winged helix-turn-helix transcriptional regulator n=1 Tax=Marinomonas sp. S3726 TaxID=579484 RepID=UPI0005F9B98E|nr:helix-turn-helix domain-containing protein [Marinomonas sp. S3726]KJZ15651.1 transcriptional regulator [Marinomonas sp. S3726]